MSVRTRPFAVDPTEYPFTDHWMPYRDGYIHYVDEGRGPNVLLLHGNPTWSYLYRDVVKALRDECRLVVPDYPGFGMSKAPTDYHFTPQEHSDAVTSLIQQLGLTNLVLVVQDWGGPIGMNYAVRNRINLRGLVVMNTWAWPASGLQKIFSVVMGGWPVGYLLQTRRNFFAKSMLPDGIFNQDQVTDTFRKAYTDPFPTPRSRIPTWIFPRQIRKAHSWLANIEAGLSNLSDVPAKILWGTHDDPGFATKEMVKWQRMLPNQETETLEDASHSVPEDRPDRVAESIQEILVRTLPDMARGAIRG
jgi:haloalkane dehalogenase